MRDGVPADPRTIRELLNAADELLTFGHDPVNGSWQIPPDANAVHLAGSFVHKALAQLDNAPRGLGQYTYRVSPECRLVPDPDSGVVLDPQHNDTP